MSAHLPHRPAIDRSAHEPLWREALGRRLRALRLRRGATLADVAARAGIAPQYLSEVERGRKDPSSEMVAAIAGALGVTLLDLTVQVARSLEVEWSSGGVLDLAARPSDALASVAWTDQPGGVVLALAA
ncbi:helix-turn-helix domain-containing protein [Agrococcus sp. SGAir0287]|uniref:helix-turn-helix domain-containing protein n=1 Tax=Agrococcus sp. SGAir0287 TaxID=2070347 RepID=UPI0010CCD0E2|nr:helix-turn-helix transcriptional regulator [Agrococcus sp. SGAir0287]QCR18824.1 XRE family transcriptional regulator [Agrococcus sp. SGAir0287]